MNPSPATPLPRLLLAEDNPISASFLLDALAALPAQAQLAGTLAAAETAARTGHFDLFLFDANLPDGSGEDLLRKLRAQGITTPALAHTADTTPDVHARLHAAGFIEVLLKPITTTDLHAALYRHLPDGLPTMPPWDDAAALRALGGQPAHVQALRELFLGELPEQRRRIVQAATHAEVPALRAELHRLSASCGFVGAVQLGEAVQALQEQLLDPAALRALEAAIGELLSA